MGIYKIYRMFINIFNYSLLENSDVWYNHINSFKENGLL